MFGGSWISIYFLSHRYYIFYASCKWQSFLIKSIYLLELKGIEPTLASTSSPVQIILYQCHSETGFAKVAGMEKDLHLIGLRYNIAAAILFVRARWSN